MKRRVIFIIIIVIIVFSGCTKKEESKLNTARASYVELLEKSSEDKLVIKFNNDNDEVSYYVYNIQDSSYTMKLVTLHDKEKTYDEVVEKYGSMPIYSLVKEEEWLITEITLQDKRNIQGDVKEFILEQYKDRDEFTIIK